MEHDLDYFRTMLRDMQQKNSDLHCKVEDLELRVKALTRQLEDSEKSRHALAVDAERLYGENQELKKERAMFEEYKGYAEWAREKIMREVLNGASR